MTAPKAEPSPVALGFVAYRAEPNLVARLELAYAAGYQVYVFDNSPERELIRDTCRRLAGVQYRTCGRNVGLGVGIAAVCSQAFYDGFVALVFFDQDTVFDRSTLDFISTFHSRNPNVAMTHSAMVFNTNRAGETNETDPFAHRDVVLAISSGCLFYLENLRRMGWHNPTYFVDGVDYEFCLNSSNHGLRVGECSNTPGFDHESEQAGYTDTVFGRRRRLRRYSWARIADATLASGRLFRAAVTARNGRFAWAISHNLVGYMWLQLLSRILRTPAPGR